MRIDEREEILIPAIPHLMLSARSRPDQAGGSGVLRAQAETHCLSADCEDYLLGSGRCGGAAVRAEDVGGYMSEWQLAIIRNVHRMNNPKGHPSPEKTEITSYGPPTREGRYFALRYAMGCDVYNAKLYKTRAGTMSASTRNLDRLTCASPKPPSDAKVGTDAFRADCGHGRVRCDLV